MAEQAEIAFIKTVASNLGNIPVNYPDDYQQPPSNWLKKVPIIPVGYVSSLRAIAASETLA